MCKLTSAIISLSGLWLLGCSPAQQSTDIKAETAPAVPSASQSVKDATGLEMFLGTWQSTGDAFGQPAVSTMRWTPALQDRFIRLDYAINPPSQDRGKSIFTGVAYYKMGDDGSMKAFWADTTGDLHPIISTFHDKTLTSIWGVEGQKLGKTRYAMDADSKITVTDWIKRDGEFRQFNQNTFSRIANSGD